MFDYVRKTENCSSFSLASNFKFLTKWTYEVSVSSIDLLTIFDQFIISSMCINDHLLND